MICSCSIYTPYDLLLSVWVEQPNIIPNDVLTGDIGGPSPDDMGTMRLDFIRWSQNKLRRNICTCVQMSIIIVEQRGSTLLGGFKIDQWWKSYKINVDIHVPVHVSKLPTSLLVLATCRILCPSHI